MTHLFDVAELSRVGGRTRNEDACGSAESHGVYCWAVADGLGGHRGGETAAHLAVEAALAAFREHPGIAPEDLTRYVAAANAAVVAGQQADPALRRMRSTLVLLVSDGRHALWAHVGDARLYRLEGGRLRCRTRDHSVSQAMVDAGQIAAHEQAQHEDRDRLLKAVGQEGGVDPAIPSTPELLRRGDAFLLCSDGFWQAASDLAIEIDLAASATAEQWLQRLERRVVATLDADSDNYTALAVRVSREATTLPPPRPADAAELAEPRAGAGAHAARPPARETTQTWTRAIVIPIVVVLGLLLGVVLWQKFGRPAARGVDTPAVPNVTTPPPAGAVPPSVDGAAPSVSGSTAPSGGTEKTPVTAIDTPREPSSTTGAGERAPLGPADLEAGSAYRVAAAARYATLAGALTAAGAGEEIWLGPGRHAAPPNPIARSIRLRGAGRDRTTIDAGGATGLVMTGERGGLADLAICCTGGAVLEIGGRFAGTLRHLRLRDGAGVGLLLRDTAAPTIDDVDITGNAGGRILIQDDAQPVFADRLAPPGSNGA